MAVNHGRRAILPQQSVYLGENSWRYENWTVGYGREIEIDTKEEGGNLMKKG